MFSTNTDTYQCSMWWGYDTCMLLIARFAPTHGIAFQQYPHHTSLPIFQMKQRKTLKNREIFSKNREIFSTKQKHSLQTGKYSFQNREIFSKEPSLPSSQHKLDTQLFSTFLSRSSAEVPKVHGASQLPNFLRCNIFDIVAIVSEEASRVYLSKNTAFPAQPIEMCILCTLCSLLRCAHNLRVPRCCILSTQQRNILYAAEKYS